MEYAVTFIDNETKEEKKNCISQQDIQEYTGVIIDIFEDFLEDKGINIPNEERDEAMEESGDTESPAILYGTDYYTLEDQVKNVFVNLLEGK